MTRSGTRLLVTATAAACVAFLVCMPRAIEPSEMPALSLDPEASADAVARDARAARGDGVDAERARETERADRALTHALANADGAPSAELAFATRYGLVREGRWIAPPLVARAFFKVRWNAAHGRRETEGLAAIERQAYFGFLALTSPDTPTELREHALEEYAAAGGPNADEARALMHAAQGHFGDAFLGYLALFRATGELRYRNHARWAGLAMD